MPFISVSNLQSLYHSDQDSVMSSALFAEYSKYILNSAFIYFFNCFWSVSQIEPSWALKIHGFFVSYQLIKAPFCMQTGPVWSGKTIKMGPYTGIFRTTLYHAGQLQKLKKLKSEILMRLCGEFLCCWKPDMKFTQGDSSSYYYVWIKVLLDLRRNCK